MRCPALYLMVALVFSAACARRTITPIDLTDTDFDYGFLVLLDESEQTLYLSEAFRTPGAQDGPLPAVEDQPNATIAHVVGLRESELRSLIPDFDASRWQELRLLNRPPPITPEFNLDTVLTMLPPNSSSLRAEFPDSLLQSPLAPLAANITLNAPLRFEQCRPEALSPLLPLGPVEHQVGPAPNDHLKVDLLRIKPLDASHFIAIAARALYVFEQGSSFVERRISPDQSGTSLHREAIPGVVDLQGLLIQGNRVLTAGVGTSSTVIVELEFEADALRWVSTSSTVNIKAIDIAWAEDGGVLLLGEDGGLLAIHDGGADQPLPALQTQGRPASRLINTGDVNHPYLAASDGLIHLFDKTEGRWMTKRVDLAADGGEARIDALLAHRAEDGTLELWVGTQSFGIYRKHGSSPWERLTTLRLPPRMMGCSMGQYPDGASNRDVLDLAPFNGQIVAVIEECSGLLMFRPGDDCVSLVTLRGDSATYISDDLISAAVVGSSVVVVGEQGRAFFAKESD